MFKKKSMVIFRISVEKWIEMSTNKSSIGAVVLEIALDILEKYLKLELFFC
jgi:hypothetical protein